MTRSPEVKGTVMTATTRTGLMASAAQVAYLPVNPASLATPIALIGCGGISGFHLAAYAAAGYHVVALCDVVAARAHARRQEYFPDAEVYTDHYELLARADVEVVDIATHVDVRPGLVCDALDAGKDVLSQKPFARTIATGRELIDRARTHDRLLAVNQNARWAPHFSYLLAAIRSGLIGEGDLGRFLGELAA